MLSAGEGKWECPYCIRAKSFCELLELPKDLFNNIIARNDTNVLMKDEISKIGHMRLIRRHRIQEMQKSGKVHLAEISLRSHDLDYLDKSSRFHRAKLGHLAANTMRMLKHHHHKHKKGKPSFLTQTSNKLSKIRHSFTEKRRLHSS